MSATSKPIELRIRGKGSGPITYVADPQSDEESTEMVTNFFKVRPTPLPMNEDVWSLMNQDFAREGGHCDEYFCPQKATVTKCVNKVSPATTFIDDNEWMAMNADFARESRMEEEEPELVQTTSNTPALGEPYGDYGVWWE